MRSNSKEFKEICEAQLDFSEGLRGGMLGGGMDIFRNYTFEWICWIAFFSFLFHIFLFAERLSFSSYRSQEGLCQGSQTSASEGTQTWHWSSSKLMNVTYILVKLNFIKLIFRQFILKQCRKLTRWYIFFYRMVLLHYISLLSMETKMLQEYLFNMVLVLTTKLRYNTWENSQTWRNDKRANFPPAKFIKYMYGESHK